MNPFKLNIDHKWAILAATPHALERFLESEVSEVKRGEMLARVYELVLLKRTYASKDENGVTICSDKDDRH